MNSLASYSSEPLMNLSAKFAAFKTARFRSLKVHLENFGQPFKILSRGQMKIQQMAFVLVALMVFFAMVALFYFSFSLGSLEKGAQSLQQDEAKELVRKMASTSEFAFTSKDCSNCIDMVKVLVLKDRGSYEDFWNLDFLQIKKVHPSSNEIECEKSNYPDCNTITIIPNEEIGSPPSAFVSLCSWEQSQEFFKCELGRILASGKDLK
jgi:hypothetical protein